MYTHMHAYINIDTRMHMALSRSLCLLDLGAHIGLNDFGARKHQIKIRILIVCTTWNVVNKSMVYDVWHMVCRYCGASKIHGFWNPSCLGPWSYAYVLFEAPMIG